MKNNRPSIPHEKTARNAEILCLFREGIPAEGIASRFGVTRQRIHQILRREGLSAKDGGKYIRAQKRAARRLRDRDAHCLNKHGCTFEQYWSLVKHGKMMMARGIKRYRTPTGAFRLQAQNAKSRGIPWELKLWDWWQIWDASGKWNERGRGQGYVMCRHGDTGPYSADNVFIAPATQNNSEWKSSGLPIGVSQVKSGNYRALRRIDGKRVELGVYRTPEEAHQAYRAKQALPSRLKKQKKIKLCPHCNGALN